MNTDVLDATKEDVDAKSEKSDVDMSIESRTDSLMIIALSFGFRYRVPAAPDLSQSSSTKMLDLVGDTPCATDGSKTRARTGMDPEAGA